MIEIEKAEEYRCCNVCNSQQKVFNITFWTNKTNSGTQVALCEKCLNELKIKIAETERKKGQWIDERPNCYTRKVYCSECGHVALNEVKSEGDVYNPRNTFDFALSNYCPYCGAEMKNE